MIFFTDKIPDFKAKNGMNISPIECVLADDTIGYFLGDDWKSEIEAKIVEMKYGGIRPSSKEIKEIRAIQKKDVSVEKLIAKKEAEIKTIEPIKKETKK